ncbi:MAG TPA: cytochrome c oxidase subunit 3 [Polyangiaceae bacterium]|nr:cytochrome c oxidase subunit 3 [Polyangiaceae bacterium]
MRRSEPQAVLQEQFGSLEQQQHAARFGMWLFLTSEVLLFGALFALYTAYRLEYAEAFRSAARHNAVWLGTANTLVLITSSLFAAWAAHAVKSGRAIMAELCLLGTLALGGLFLFLKLTEYADHFRHGIYPGAYFRSPELGERGAGTFFTLYYFMTGLHGLHVVGGMSALAIMLLQISRGRYGPGRSTAVELSVLYWHLVDVIWIFLWPLFYLLT